MAYYPRLAATVTFGGLCSVASPAWSKTADAVAEYRAAVRLVESNPVLDLRHSSEADSGIVFKIGDKFLLIEESTITFVEAVWHVPVENSDNRDNAGVKEVIDKLDVVLHPCLIDWITPST